MNVTESKTRSLFELVNDHKFNNLEGFISQNCQWKTLEGKLYSGVSAIQEMWTSRCMVFPDFQLEIEK
ncbi:MAG: hypothetical protein ACKVOK_00890, partial [Flavobacteriales bacterium]